MAAPLELTRTHRILIGLVVTGAVVIAGIGFAGSYAAVRELALKKGFGTFSYVFPIGIDAGICVLLSLDLLLTWIRIPFPLLRQAAWLLTAATIAFNGAAAWPDPLGVGMHAVIPVLFVVAVEAARHAIGRIADITADRHMEGVRLTRWLLSPVPTFLLWRRMKLWELRSYDQVIKLEQERLVYRARLRSRYGRAWRRKAPVESLMPLRLARYGVPLAQTAAQGLAAAGIEPALLPPEPAAVETPNSGPATAQLKPAPARPAEPEVPEEAAEAAEAVVQAAESPVQVPVVPGGRTRPLGGAVSESVSEDEPAPAPATPHPHPLPVPSPRAEPEPTPAPIPAPADAEPTVEQAAEAPAEEPADEPLAEYLPEPPEEPGVDDYYGVFRRAISEQQSMPTLRQFGTDLETTFGVVLSQAELRYYWDLFVKRFNAELAEDHIA
ncbi:DUF2637 domain-containing protein [Streptomyces sp. NPDC058045]|uniref:DUF2637 domain-containing protein n=1 Tax=Streptomyces sp. NPDC058045 TaxID=3346311 RepID=UPI0036E07598